MGDSASAAYWKFDNLKGAKNYQQWATRIEGLSIKERTWKVVSGRTTRPGGSRLPLPAISVTDEGGSASKAAEIVVSEVQEKWDDLNDDAWAMFQAKIELSIWHNFSHTRDAHTIWKLAKSKFGQEDSTTVDHEIASLCACDANKHKSVQEYYDYIMKHQNRLITMGKPVPDWILSSMFRKGLTADQAPYIFHLLESAKNGKDGEKKEITLDEMTSALVEQERRMNDMEETKKAMKASVGNFGKQEKKKGGGKGHTNNNKKDPCGLCNSPTHPSERCFYDHPDLRPDGWEAAKGKDHLLIENKNKKVKKSSTDENSKSKGSSDDKKSSKKEPKMLMARLKSHMRNDDSDDKDHGHHVLAKMAKKQEPGSTHDTALYADSGADVHVFWDRSKFTDYKNVVATTLSGVDDDAPLEVEGIGNVTIEAVVDGITQSVTLTEAYYVPDSAYNLLSIGAIEDKGTRVIFDGGRVEVIDHEDDEVLMTGSRNEGNTYIIDLAYHKAPIALRSSRQIPHKHCSWTQLHKRFGHPGMNAVKKAAQATTGINGKKADTLEALEPQEACASCMCGKMQKRYTRIPHRQQRLYEGVTKGARWHLDLAGGGNIKRTAGGARYIMALTDDTTDVTFAYYLKLRSEIPYYLQKFVTYMKTKGITIQYMKSDLELRSQKVENLFTEHGIEWEPTAPDSPQQNGVAERTFRTLFERVRAILHDSGMPQKFWAEAVAYVLYCKWRLPIKLLGNKTPYEAWHGTKPDVSHLRPFGCCGFAYDHHTDGKLYMKGRPVRLLGYGGNNQYKLWDLKKKKATTSSQVVFDEKADYRRHGETNEYNDNDSWNFFTESVRLELDEEDDYIQHTTDDSSDNDNSNTDYPIAPRKATPGTPPTDLEDEDIEEEEGAKLNEEIATDRRQIVGHGANDSDSSETESDVGSSQYFDPNGQDSEGADQSEGEAAATPTDPTTEPESSSSDEEGVDLGPNVDTGPRRSNRSNNTRPDYHKLHMYGKDGRRGRRVRARIFKMLAKAAQLKKPDAGTIPVDYEEAMTGPEREEWLKALKVEYKRHRDRQTWRRRRPPRGTRVLKGRWVFTKKLDEFGNVIKYKARWVAKGFSQRKGIDYNETYSSVIKSVIWRIMFAMAAKYGMVLEHSDVITAFLEATLKEEVWVEQPHGFVDNEEYACLLNKALYGLKQSPREWYEHLRGYLESIGFYRVLSDESLFMNEATGVIVAVYVDDFLMAAPDQLAMDNFKRQLDQKFQLKHLGGVANYLGMQITRDIGKRTLFVNQAGYIRQLLEQLGMTQCKISSTPMEKGVQLHKAPPDYQASEEEKQPYQSLIGALQWLSTMIRSDISYAVSKLNRYTLNPTEQHISCAQRVVRYLAGTIEYGILFAPDEDKYGVFQGYSDASFADDVDSSRSTGACVFKLWNAPIMWRSKLQPLVTLSSAESEYVSVSDAAKEAIYISALLQELGYAGGDVKQVTLNVDNQAAIAMSANNVYHPRTKHIRLRYHHIRELVSLGQLKLEWVDTKRQAADILTKPLGPIAFAEARTLIGVRPHPGTALT